MHGHLISEPISLCQCARCGAYVFRAMDEGSPAMVDTTPLTVEQMRLALIHGAMLYDVVNDPRGKPLWLRARQSYSKWPPPGAVMAAHPCSAVAHKVPVVVPPKGRAGHTPGQPVTSATHPRSKKQRQYLYIRCDAGCGEFIGHARDIVGVHSGIYWEWAMHAECAK